MRVDCLPNGGFTPLLSFSQSNVWWNWWWFLDLASHYACYELPSLFSSGPLTPREQLLRVLVLLAMVGTAGFVVVFGFGGLFTLYLVVSVGVAAAQDVHRRVQLYIQQFEPPRRQRDQVVR